MARIDGIIERLHGLHPRLIDLSLDRLLALLAKLGHPERRLPPIFHVAGTNGKGSTCAFLRAMGEAAGMRVHVYTSPHLIRFNERIRVASEIVSDADLTAAMEEIERANDGAPITVFEVITAAAFHLFAAAPAELCVLEVGLGGRGDATNVIPDPAACAITSISLDHRELLGPTLDAIAREKAGIMKRGVPVATGVQPDAVIAMLEAEAEQSGAPLLKRGRDWSIEAEGGGLRFRDKAGGIDLPFPSLPGPHQLDNAGIAIAAMRAAHLGIPNDAIGRGIAAAEWPARMQCLTGALMSRLPPDWELWLDGGHNPGAGDALAAHLASWRDRPIHLVVGMKQAKDSAEFLRPLIPLTASLWAVAEPEQHSALPVEAIIAASGGVARPGPLVTDALRKIPRGDGPARVLICGSLYLAGEVLKLEHRMTIVRVLALALVLSSPAYAAWDSFEIIQWQPRSPAQWETLRRLGVTAAMLTANRDGTGVPLAQQSAAPRTAGLRWYIENIATDLFASYHRYTPDKPVNWRFIAAQERYRANPNDSTALFREPSLEDPVWRERISARLMETVRQQKPFRPLYYSLGDETGIADLTAYWDFDLSPPSVAGFRTWLHGQYGSLEELNTEWGATYASWDAIRPETTRETMRRTDDNFAAWNDFKAWMDTSFADALRSGTDAIHRADPAALSAMEGVQIPGWGGYDYTKLARAVDVMEISDGGDDLPILHAANSRVIPLITSFVASPAEVHRIWRAVLFGARGLILWDEDDSITRPDASPGPRAPIYAPLFAALHGEVGRRLIGADLVTDSVAMLYSPVSFRVRWMLDHRPHGDAWMHRSSEAELEDNAWRIAMRDYSAVLERRGLHPRFITPEQLASGPPVESTLILPHAIALSAAEAEAIKKFMARGGTVIADTPPGQFDGHGRRLPAPSVTVPIVPPDEFGRTLTIAPPFRVEPPDNDVDLYLFRSRGRRLLALQSRSARETSETVTIALNGSHARDIATDRDYGRPARLSVTLDKVTPTVLEIDR